MTATTPTLTPVKILLVDDQMENLFALEELLKGTIEPIQFLQATSGQEALKTAFFEDLALILLDVQMPEMDGYEVAQLLKTNRKTRHVPIIFVTALNQDIHYVLEGYEKGAVDYLFKPLNPSLTRAKVRSFTAMHLQQKEMEKLTQLVNNSLDLMCVVDDRTLTISTFNPAWETQLGYRAESIKERPFAEAIAFPAQELADQLAKVLAEKSSVHHFESKVLAGNEEEKYIAWSLVHKDGSWFINGKDITIRKEAEYRLALAKEQLEQKVRERTAALETTNAQLKRSNADLDNFIYAASHDLKSPINNIGGLMTYLKKYLPQDSQQATNITAMIDQSIVRFQNVLKEMTEVIRLDNIPAWDGEGADFLSLLEEVKLDLHGQIQELDARLTEQLEVASVGFSRKNLRSILHNLLTNALKYHDPERRSEVTIRTFRDADQRVVLTVTDNGLGIKKENLPQVFEMFKRLHTHVEGSGMGLYLVKKIVESGGGEITVTSEVDQGTEFQVTFGRNSS